MQATVTQNHKNFNISDMAKANLNMESIKGPSLAVVRHKIDQLSRLWLYPWAVNEQ
jgi:hypothetical protein